MIKTLETGGIVPENSVVITLGKWQAGILGGILTAILVGSLFAMLAAYVTVQSNRQEIVQAVQERHAIREELKIRPTFRDLDAVGTLSLSRYEEIDRRFDQLESKIDRILLR